MSPSVADTKFSAKQQAAIAALLEGNSQADAARLAGVTKRTIQRWLLEEAFAAELRAGGDAAIRTAGARLAGSVESAVTALIDVVEEPTADGAAVRLRAADTLLNQALRLREHNDLSDRVAALESRLGDK